jgi:hypothetical protein
MENYEMNKIGGKYWDVKESEGEYNKTEWEGIGREK